MQIEPIDVTGDNQGVHPYGNRYYLDALYSTLISLKPKICLEIGTNHGNSTRVFQKYFDNYCTDGLLITCDIKEYFDAEQYTNVKFVKVNSHIENYKDWHVVKSHESLPVTKTTVDNSDTLNRELLLAALDGKKFDFAFIDGDHTRPSVMKDLAICLDLTHFPHHILIDDIWENNPHDVYQIYHTNIVNDPLLEHYEYQNWPQTIGMGLIKEKEGTE